MVSVVDAKTLTLTLTLTSLAAVSCTNAIDALRTNEKKQRRKRLLAFAITGIACLHYIFLYFTKQSSIFIRYSDWYVTCPLMFLEFALLLEIDVIQQIVPMLMGVVGIVGMLTCGLYAEKSRQGLVVGMGFVFLAVMYGSLLYSRSQRRDKKEKNRQDAAVFFFLAVWIFYGVVFFLRGDRRSVAFNILDFISKVGLGSYVLLS